MTVSSRTAPSADPTLGIAVLAGECTGPELSAAPVGPAAGDTTALPQPSAAGATTRPAVSTIPSASAAGSTAPQVPVSTAPVAPTPRGTAPVRAVRTRRTTPGPTATPSPTFTFPPLGHDLFDGVPRVDDLGYLDARQGGPGHWTIRFDRVAIVPCDMSGLAVESGYCNHCGGRIVDDDKLRTYPLSPDVPIVDRSAPDEPGVVIDPQTWFARTRGDGRVVLDLTVTAQGVVTAADIPFQS